MADVMDFA